MSKNQIVVWKSVITILVLSVLYLIIEYGWWIFPKSHKYSINFENNLTYSNDGLSIVVGKNGLESPKVLNLHGLTNQTMILSSIFTTQTGKVIDSLKFEGKNKVPLNLTLDNLTSVEVSVLNPESGKYHGWLYLTNGSTSTIPIILSTEPKVIQAIFLVVIGVLVSIIFWEIFFILNNRQTKNTITALGNANAARLKSLFPNTTEAQQNTKRNEMVARKQDRIAKIESRYTVNAPKIISFEFAQVIFGIITAMIATLSNPYVSSSIEITPEIAVTLIGIGLGIGSIKGLVDN